MDTPEFDIYHIYPSVENAKAVIDLRYSDLRRAGLSFKRAEELANSENEHHVERQVKNLEEYPERYLGAVALGNGDWVGYSNVSEWTAEDQLPFCDSVERFARKAMIKCMGNRLIGKPLGIHELVVVDDVSARKEILDELFNRAIEVAESSEIYTAQYDDEIILRSLYENGFKSTGKYCDLPNGFRELYIRPFPAPEPDYGYKKGLSKLLNLHIS